MANRNSTRPNAPSGTKTAPCDSLYNAAAEFAEIRASLLLASEVLNDSAFSGGNAITEERDVSAVLVLRRAVTQLADLQVEMDRITVELSQPKAIAQLHVVRHD
jgi:hypothetical protein